MNRFTYTRVGAYWIPELKLTEQSDLLLAGEEPFVIRYKKEVERQSASGASARLNPPP